MISLQCGCGRQINVQDSLAGKRIKCPQCQAVVQVPHSSEAIQEGGAVGLSPSDDKKCPGCNKLMLKEAVVCIHCGLNVKTGQRLQTKIKKSVQKERRADKWTRVRLGLAFHRARLIIFLFTPVFLIFASVVGGMASGAGRGAGLVGGALVVIAGLVLLAALLVTPILGIIGSVLCAWVPKKTARTLILVSFGLDAGSFGLGIVQIVLMLARVLGAPMFVLVFQFLQLGLTLAAWVLFMLFLRRMAHSLEEWGHADEAGSIILVGALLVLGPPVVLVGLGLLIAAMVSRENAGAVVGAMLLVTMVLVIPYIVFLFKFLFRQLELLGYLRGVIAKKLAEE